MNVLVKIVLNPGTVLSDTEKLKIETEKISSLRQMFATARAWNMNITTTTTATTL